MPILTVPKYQRVHPRQTLQLPRFPSKGTLMLYSAKLPFCFRPNTHRSILTLIGGVVCAAALLNATNAQAKIYRCGNEYTNDANYAMKNGCDVMTGGNVTIVQGTRSDTDAGMAAGSKDYTVASELNRKRAALPKSVSQAKARRVSNVKQQQRDRDTRSILEAELQQAKTRLSEMEKEYNNGKPERWGSERNYQKYLDRVAKMRSDIERQRNDIQGLQREISRIPSSTTM